MRVAVLGVSLLSLVACTNLPEDEGSDGPADDLGGDLECGAHPDDTSCASVDDCELDARDATCGGEIYECDEATGEWEIVAWCDPGFLKIRGDVSLIIGLGDPIPEGCPTGLVARTPLVIVGAADDTFSAAEPTVVIEASTDTTVRPATGSFSITDEWTSQAGPVPVELQLELTFDDDGLIAGEGTISAGPGCQIQAEVGGEYVPTWELGG